MNLKNFALGIFVSCFSIASASAEELKLGSIFSSNQTASQSFLRFYNSDDTSGNATVTLQNATSGEVLAQWASPIIPGGSEMQFRITTPEDEADRAFTKPDFYTIKVDPTFNGAFQHVLWKPADGTLTNLSTCAGNVNANITTAIAFHSSLLDTGYPSTLVIRNSGFSSSVAELTITDARDGTELGVYTTAAIPADGQLLLSAADIEAEIGVTPTSGMFHYNISVTNGFSGYLQQLVTNQTAGVVTDMTAVCILTANTGTTTSTFEGVVSGSADESGSLTLTVEADVQTDEAESSSSQRVKVTETAQRVFERPSANVNASGTFVTTGGDTINLNGTFDTATNAVNVSGSGYSFDGSIDATNGTQRLSGNYTGPTSSGGYSAARRSPTSRVRSKFCGNWSGTVDGGFVEGTWNFTIYNNDSLVGRTANKTDGDNQNMTGTERGRRVSGTTTDGTTFNGTINGTSTTFTGTFNSDGDTGELSGTRCD